MTVLPSPIPHPLDLLPWDLPDWAYEGLEFAVGAEWPEGNEQEVWDLADQWFAVASALVGPRDDAFAAAGEVLTAYGNTGAVGAAFDQAWREVADGDDAPLLVLLSASSELGRLVEQCGCDIEGAKIEIWIQVGILVVELLALAVAVVLTLGAASPAAAAAIAATRAVIQQIFRRLVAQLARKAVKAGVREAAERAATEVTERGLKSLARKAAIEGLEETAEEVGTDLGTQAYQDMTGRRDGLDVSSLGMSAVGGFAGGAGASLAGLGRHASSRGGRVAENIGREMAGEVLGESAARLGTGGGLPGLDDLARSATSGAGSSAVHQTSHLLNHNLDVHALSGPPLSLSGPPLSPSGPPFSPTNVLAPPAGVDGLEPTSPPPGMSESVPAHALPDHDVVAPTRPHSGDYPVVDAGSSSGVSPHDLGSVQRDSTSAGPTSVGTVAATPTGSDARYAGPLSSDVADVGLAGVAAPADSLTASPIGAPTTAAPSGAPSPSMQTPASSVQPPVQTGPTTLQTAPLAEPPVQAGPAPVQTGPATVPAPGATSRTTSMHAPTAGVPSVKVDGLRGPTAAPVVPGSAASAAPAQTGHSGSASSDRDLSPPTPAPPRQRMPRLTAILQGLDRRGYRDHARSQRQQFEQRRREDQASRLRRRAEVHENRARRSAARAIESEHAGERQLAQRWAAASTVETRRADRLRDRAEAVLSGAIAPPRVEVDGDAAFRRINDDVGNLVDAGGQPDTRSALTGTDHPPGVDRSRRYGERGGLRRPLALHQTDLERKMPRDRHGNVVRTADPRQGRWFRLSNDGGPRADPTRSINCLDCTLSFYDTWVHGRPRVSAPRTFDGYAGGNINYPVGGEADGPGRVEDVTGGRFQRLCPDVRRMAPAAARQVVQGAYADLHNQLLAGGHGSYAFVVNEWEGGLSHAWIAVNQSGTVLYLDPQSGSISENTPLYGHSGLPDDGNVTSLDALVLDRNAKPMPLPGRPPGLFTRRPPLPPATGPRSRDSADIDRVHLLEGATPLAAAVSTLAPAPGGSTPDASGSSYEPGGRAHRVGRGGAASEVRDGRAEAALGGAGPEVSIPAAHMLRDPTEHELAELGVGRATFADLGLDPHALSPQDRDRYERALRKVALVAPEKIRFTQRSVSPRTSDGISGEDLIDDMRDGGWRGEPLHGVRWGDGSLSSVDNRRLRAARRAGLATVPFVVHSPSDRLADWPGEWSRKKRRANALAHDIRELDDGSWIIGGDEGRIVYAKGTIPLTYGEIALFRAAEQRSLLPGHLFGAQREPVMLARPPDPNQPVRLSAAEQEVLDDLRLRATAAADQVESELADIGRAVTAGLGLTDPMELRGQEHRIKSAQSLARKYNDQARADGIDVVEFARQVNDALRFSMALPPGQQYQPALRRVFAELSSRGYHLVLTADSNYWVPGNRFYGFNCTVRSPLGHVFELQLPTEASWRGQKMTHRLYEIVRQDGAGGRPELPARRVHALLQMLATNKHLSMPDAIPPGIVNVVPPNDASFASWIADNQGVWRQYKAWLDLNGRTFAEIAAEFGLAAADFPVSADVAAKLGEADVHLLLDL